MTTKPGRWQNKLSRQTTGFDVPITRTFRTEKTTNRNSKSERKVKQAYNETMLRQLLCKKRNRAKYWAAISLLPIAWLISYNGGHNCLFLPLWKESGDSVVLTPDMTPHARWAWHVTLYFSSVGDVQVVSKTVNNWVNSWWVLFRPSCPCVGVRQLNWVAWFNY